MVDVELREDVRDMRLHGALADGKRCGDSFVGLAVGHELNPSIRPIRPQMVVNKTERI